MTIFAEIKTNKQNKMNISKTITPKSDQLNADDLIGGSMNIKIRDVKVIDSEIQPLQIFFDGDNNKPYKPSKGMRRVLIQLWGTEGDNFVGKSLTLYRDENVKFGGDSVGGIRISHASHINEPTRVLETVSKGKRRPITINVLKTSKKALTNIDAAKKALQDKTVTFEKLIETYDLKAEQIKILKDETV